MEMEKNLRDFLMGIIDLYLIVKVVEYITMVVSFKTIDIIILPVVVIVIILNFIEQKKVKNNG